MRLNSAIAPRVLRGVFGLLFLWLFAYEVHIVLAPRLGVHGVFSKYGHLVVLLLAAGLTLTRVVVRPRERLAWGFVGAAVLAWSLGELYYTAALWNLSVIPVPSLADGGYLAFPLLAFVGICLLARHQSRRTGVTLWADGIAGALAIGAVSAAFVLDPVLRHASGRPLEVITNLAYPVTDLVMLGACVVMIAVRGWRVDRTWGLIASGVIVFWVADSLYLVETALGTYTPGGVFDIGWWLGLVLVAVAAWQPTSDRTTRRGEQRGWFIALPIASGALAAGVLAYGALRVIQLNVGAVVLASAALGAVSVRLLVTYRGWLSLLDAVQAESLSDALTELPNRRALSRDLAERARPLQASSLLAMYDLDGFKHYNDVFGHPAGDALLARLGRALEVVVFGHGTAYRMGGDEFCVLVDGELSSTSQVLEAAAGALREHGEGFSISSSWGAVCLPEEACSPEEALRLADQRMYAQKQSRRPPASRQTTDVLLRALAERHPDLDDHARDVATLAEHTARGLRLRDEEVERVRLAAELHDVGKVAIPDSIITKPGPLDDQEWQFMRRHPVIGERILAAAPSLQHVAELVRASHERVDGAGYPDQLRGAEIPLGARIVAVCDAFDAMTTARPYSRPKKTDEAIAELRRCAGTQFDERVVEAFCLVATARIAPTTARR